MGHRAFHSTRDDVDQAVPVVTGAVVSMLASAWSYGPYDALIVAFDHPTNRRRELEPAYKANRPPTPPELREALVELHSHLATGGIAVHEVPGAEADDILATVADASARRGWHCDLLSSDRDLTACVDASTRLLRPQARFSELIIEDVAGVRARYGIDPAQYVDLAALRGDPSDGLDGAEGIGPKIAARLLRDHGSVAGIYAALHDLPPKLEASLRAARDRVERNLLLMAPIPHLAVDVEVALRRGVDPERVADVLRGLGLDAAARRFHRALTQPLPPPPPPPPPPPGEGSVADELAGVPSRPLPPAASDGEQTALF